MDAFIQGLNLKWPPPQLKQMVVWWLHCSSTKEREKQMWLVCHASTLVIQINRLLRLLTYLFLLMRNFQAFTQCIYLWICIEDFCLFNISLSLLCFCHFFNTHIPNLWSTKILQFQKRPPESGFKRKQFLIDIHVKKVIILLKIGYIQFD